MKHIIYGDLEYLETKMKELIKENKYWIFQIDPCKWSMRNTHFEWKLNFYDKES